MAKAKPVFDADLQWGRQTPDGQIEWHYELTASKLGWTTVTGRLEAQSEFDAEIRSLGLPLDERNLLRFYTRRREFTAPELVQDVTEVPAEAPAPETVTAIDVSGTESREATDPSHLVVDPEGLLVGTVTPTPTPAAEVPENPVPDWAQTAPVPVAESVTLSASTPSITINNPVGAEAAGEQVAKRIAALPF